MKYIIYTFLFLFSFNSVAQLTTAKPWMGVGIEQVKQGIKITQAIDNTPAKAAGLKSGDIITHIDGKKLNTPQELIQYVQNKGVGNQVSLKVIIKPKEIKEYTLKLAAKPSSLEALKNKTVKKELLSKMRKFKDLNKKSITLKSSKKTIVMFWATWCPACHQAMPILVNFLKENSKKIQIIFISDEETKILKKHIYKLKKEAPDLGLISFKKAEPKVINSDFGIEVLPSFVLLDESGKGLDVSIGVGSNLKNLLDLAVK